MSPPSQLDLFPDNAKLSDIATTVTVNYGRYHELSAVVKGWQEWAAEISPP